jgi:Ras association domain-containing protein 1
VIKVLLSKYHITDNPRKFALYEKREEHGKRAVLRRITAEEIPLQICLLWTIEDVGHLDHHQFVLQENDTGDIMWDAFSLPELENFLVVLNREEEEYVSQLKAKYQLLKVHMRKRLQTIEPPLKKETTSDKRTPVFV